MGPTKVLDEELIKFLLVIKWIQLNIIVVWFWLSGLCVRVLIVLFKLSLYRGGRVLALSFLLAFILLHFSKSDGSRDHTTIKVWSCAWHARATFGVLYISRATFLNFLTFWGFQNGKTLGIKRPFSLKQHQNLCKNHPNLFKKSLEPF